MRRIVFAIITLLLALATPAEAAYQGFDNKSACKRPQELADRLARSVVMFEVPQDESERPTDYMERVLWTGTVAGTAWPLARDTIVTVENVALRAHLRTDAWRKIVIHQSPSVGEVAAKVIETEAKISNIFPGVGDAQVLVALELRDELAGVRIPQVRPAYMLKHEPLIALTITEAQKEHSYTLRLATGRVTFLPSPEDDRGDEKIEDPPYITLELANFKENDRMVMADAVGSPVFDCRGEVVAVVAGFISYVMDLGDAGLRLTLPWGQPTNYSIRASSLSGRDPQGVANLAFPMREKPPSRSELLTQLTDELLEQSKRAAEGGGDPEALARAWKALRNFGLESQLQGGNLLMPTIQSPFE